MKSHKSNTVSSYQFDICYKVNIAAPSQQIESVRIERGEQKKALNEIKGLENLPFDQPHILQFIYSLISAWSKNGKGTKQPLGQRYSWAIAYVHVNGEKREDLFCFDVAFHRVVESDKVAIERLESRRPIVPARYARSTGTMIEVDKKVERVFQGDIIDRVVREFEKGGPKNKGWWQQAGLIVHDVCIKQEKKKSNEYWVQGTAKIYRFLAGEIAGVLPMPGFTENLKAASRGSVVVAPWRSVDPGCGRMVSETTWRSLENLSRVLQNRGGQRTLILGAPGSGKEMLAKACHSGSLLGRTLELDREAKGKAVEVVSLAGMSYQGVRRYLFDVVPPMKESVLGRLGNHEKSAGSIILDEFDKSNELREICGGLLRVLESKEFEQCDHSSGVTEVKEYREVNWIFSGSFSGGDPGNVIPADFWSRLRGVIQASNGIENSRSYAATLFVLFFAQRAVEFSEEDENQFLVDVFSREGGGLSAKEVVARVFGVAEGPSEVREDGAAVVCELRPILGLGFQVARLVDIERVFPADGLDSPRAVRQAAQAVFDHVVQLAIEDTQFRLPETASIASGDEMMEVADRMLRIARGP